MRSDTRDKGITRIYMKYSTGYHNVKAVEDNKQTTFP